MEDNESITTASQRMSKLAIDLKQPQTQAAEKLLNALPPIIQNKLRTKLGTKLQFQYADISTWTVELIRSEAEKLEKVIIQEKLLAPKVIHSSSSVGNNVYPKSDTRKRRSNIRCNNCGRLGHISANCRTNANKMSAKAAQYTPASFQPGPCFRCSKMGHQASQCPSRPTTNGPTNQRLPGKPCMVYTSPTQHT